VKVLELPCVEFFGGWEHMEECLRKLGNPLFSVKGDLNLNNTDIISLDNLVSVGGNLNLEGTEIKSLANLVSVGGDLLLNSTQIKSLINLVSVGGDLDLRNTNITSLDNLVSVGGDLILYWTPLRRTTTREEIRKQVDVGEIIFM